MLSKVIRVTQRTSTVCIPAMKSKWEGEVWKPGESTSVQDTIVSRQKNTQANVQSQDANKRKKASSTSLPAHNNLLHAQAYDSGDPVLG